MKNVKIISLLMAFSTMTLVSCGGSNNEVTKDYTVTWVNYNGNVLEVDEHVKEGTVPTYDGTTPVREKEGLFTYEFNGWTPEISPVKEDIKYTASFKETKGEPVKGTDPIFSTDKKTVEYGFYPQSYVSDANLITSLTALSPSKVNNWYELDGKYYIKATANTYNNEAYKFTNGTAIVNTTEYWFKCEPIVWKVLKNESNTYSLMSLLLLDSHNYYSSYEDRSIEGKTISANNYEHSDIRTWLNKDFFNEAFTLNNSYIKETTVDNSALTTDSTTNTYASNNTNDKVYLGSVKDYSTSTYGFDTVIDELDPAREAKTSDYARATGSWNNTKDTQHSYSGSYWTRSPSSEFSYSASNVNSGGVISSYAVDGTSHSVRPCITIEVK